MVEIPEQVWVVGIARDAAVYHTPIRDEKSGTNVAPLTVLDEDGERAMPVFTTSDKAIQGARHFMSAEELRDNRVGVALADLQDLVTTMSETPEGTPKIDYIGVDMGEGGTYPLIRL